MEPRQTGIQRTGPGAGVAGIVFERSALAAMGHHAARAGGRECCGLLLGADRDPSGGLVAITAVIAVPNRATRADRFDIAPADLFAVHRRSRDFGLRVLGHYHSHPNGLATPSPIDRDQISDPQALWVIVPTTSSGVIVGGVTAWKPADGNTGDRTDDLTGDRTGQGVPPALLRPVVNGFASVPVLGVRRWIRGGPEKFQIVEKWS